MLSSQGTRELSPVNSGSIVYNLTAVDNSREAKMCPLTFGNLKTFGLIDSGADISLIDKHTFDKISKHLILVTKKPTVQLRGVTGHSLQVNCKLTVKVKIGKMTLVHDFHVVKNLGKSVILGVDFMTRHQARLDFGKRTLTIGNQVIVLKDKSGGVSECSLAVFSCNQTLSPMSQGTFEVRGKRVSAGPCLITPLETSCLFYQQDSLVVPSIVSRRSRTVLPFINGTTTSFHLAKGEVVGILKALDNQEISPWNETNEVELDHNPQAQVEEVSTQHVPDDVKGSFSGLIENFRHIFAQTDRDLGQTHQVEMKLNTGDDPPIKKWPYRLPFSQRPALEKHLEQLLEANIIRPSTSPWASPIVVVPKKDGSLRMAIDYRATTNKVLVPNSYPLPNIEEILSSMQGSKVFSCLDLKSGYYQIAVAEEDREKQLLSVTRGCLSSMSYLLVLPQHHQCFSN